MPAAHPAELLRPSNYPQQASGDTTPAEIGYDATIAIISKIFSDEFPHPFTGKGHHVEAYRAANLAAPDGTVVQDGSNRIGTISPLELYPYGGSPKVGDAVVVLPTRPNQIPIGIGVGTSVHMYARLTGYPSAAPVNFSKYTWEEVKWDGESWSTEGLEGTDENHIYAIEDRGIMGIPPDTIVELVEWPIQVVSDTGAPTGKIKYTFHYELPWKATVKSCVGDTFKVVSEKSVERNHEDDWQVEVDNGPKGWPLAPEESVWIIPFAGGVGIIDQRIQGAGSSKLVSGSGEPVTAELAPYQLGTEPAGCDGS
jgi:hypothetical protein